MFPSYIDLGIDGGKTQLHGYASFKGNRMCMGHIGQV